MTIAMMHSTTSNPTPAEMRIHGGIAFACFLLAGLTMSILDCAGGTSILPLPPVVAGGSTFFIPPLGVLPLGAPVLSLGKIIPLSDPPSAFVGAPMALAT